MFITAPCHTPTWNVSDTMTDTDHSDALVDSVRAAYKKKQALRITGSGSKDFLGRRTDGEPLTVSGHRGIVEYEPTELVVTARAGTTLQELDATLRAQEQMLPFEPPSFSDTATLGGTVACGLSGPRRPFTGAARDFVLGATLINGKGHLLRFGGKVMKNVAGYDVSRLMTGAMGTLGVLLEISLKVLPRPEQETTRVLACSTPAALRQLSEWQRQPLPLSAACHIDGQLYVRLSGTRDAIRQAGERLGGEVLDDDQAFWRDLREQQLPFFQSERPLWRLSVPSAATAIESLEPVIYDWAGAQRWWYSEMPANAMHALATQLNGHATLFRGAPAGEEVFHPLSPGLAAVHKQLKAAFDPAGILNPGRMYAAF